MRFAFTLTLIALIAAGMTGCADDTALDTPGGAPETSRPAAEPQTAPRDGAGTMTLYFPTGKSGAVMLRKSAPPQVLVGKPFDYTLTVTNQTKDTLKDALLTGKLPANFNVVSTTPQASVSGGNATWSIDKLDPGESRTFVVRGSAAEAGKLAGCSDLRFTVGSACVVIEAVQPALALTKTGPAEVLICEPIEYVATITNTGSGDATNVKFRDDLPDGLVYQNQYSAVTSDIGTLKAGDSRTFKYTVTANKTGPFTNKASVTADNDLSAAAEAKTTVRQPVLKITKDAPAMRYAGTPVNYTITVSNTGDGEARNTVLTDTLPAGATFRSAGDGGQVSGRDLSWNLGTLAPGASRKVSVVVEAKEIGTLENRVAATATCAKASARATTEIKGIPAILLECVDTPDPIAIGEQTTYTITVTNQGTAVGTNIVVKCTLPGEMALVSTDGPTQAAADGKATTFAPLKTLAPGATATYKVVTRATGEGDVRFRVELTSDQMTSPATETESTRTFSDK